MLPIFRASRITQSFAVEEVLPRSNVPVFLGLNCWEQSSDPKKLARQVREAGFAGAVNFPSSMHYSKAMQQILRRAGRGIEMELEALLAAKNEGLMTMFYCADRVHARLAADAGIDFICLNLGWNVGGLTGHTRRESLEEVAVTVRDIGRLIKRIRPNARVLLEGGPIVTSEDLARLMKLAPVDGYIGGSTIERMPLEESVAKQIDEFRRAGTRSAAPSSENARLSGLAKKHGYFGASTPLYRFLDRLSAASRGTHPVLLRLVRGQEPSNAVRLLTGKSSSAARVFHIDVSGEDYPARARAQLFGRADDGRSSSPPRQSPVLSDETLDWVVIHSPDLLPDGMQRRLARTLNDRSFRPSGQRRTVPLGVRLLFVVSNAESADSGEAQGLDQSLADVLLPYSIGMPSLSDRIEDLEALITAFSGELFVQAITRDDFSTEAYRMLQVHPWDGNDAELRSFLGRLSAGAFDRPYQPETIREILEPIGQQPTTGRTERERIIQALWRHGFKKGETAAALGISRKTLYLKIQKYEIGGA